MATYSFRFNEISMNQVWFEAGSEAEAKVLMQKCIDDEMNISDLPKAEERNRGIQMDFTVSEIEY